MDISVKFNIGEKVWFRGYEENFCETIYNIVIKVDSDGDIDIIYYFWESDAIKHEYQLYTTEDELIDALALGNSN